MNLSSISFCVSNHRSRGARLFRNARLHFADAIYSPRFIDFDLPEDVYFGELNFIYLLFYENPEQNLFSNLCLLAQIQSNPINSAFTSRKCSLGNNTNSPPTCEPCEA